MELRSWLEQARTWGFLGPGPVDEHIRHAVGFAAAVGGDVPDRLLDLGSGGGVPGLVLAHQWPDTAVVLLDSNERRTAFLGAAVDDLGWNGRVQVLRARAEAAGREPALRSRFPLVVSRSFASPAVTAECAAPFLVLGGRCVVSEPPEPTAERWSAEGLRALGLSLGMMHRAGGATYRVLDQVEACPARFPRREGVPARRPLW